MYMEKIKKVFLPAWQKKFVPPLLLVIWGFTTYSNFFGSAQGDMNTIEYSIMTVILLGVGVMVWFMASGKLPAYVIKEEVTDEE